MRSTLYTNGSILTMEPGPRPEALLVTDGRIAALGGAATLSALAPDAERRDLAGGALLHRIYLPIFVCVYDEQ